MALGDAGQQRDRWQPAWDFLIGQAVARREAAQVELEAASPNFPFDIERLLAETVAAVRKPHAMAGVSNLRDLALPMLSDLVRELHAAAAGDLDDYDHLHQVRIIGKRLRYAMELFANCFASSFRETLYLAVEDMQEVLGRANDSHVAVQRLQGVRDRLREIRPNDWRRYRAGIEGLIRLHSERVPQEKQHFLEWWTRWQESGGEPAFAALLRGPSSVAS
jgi:CHAD domain-containing protein